MQRVSIVLPTYNDLIYLPRSIDSVLKQNYEDFELIVVNDGSTDGTTEYLDALGDSRVRVVHQENRGVSAALNRGVELATGDYLTWTSSDNLCGRHYLEALVAALDATPTAALAYSPFYVIDDNDRVMSVSYGNILILRELLTLEPRGNASFLYRRDSHAIVGPYQASLACDTDMWIRFLEALETVYVVEPLYFYRRHAAMRSLTQPVELMNDALGLFGQFFERLGNACDGKTIAKLYPALRSPECGFSSADAFADLCIRQGLKLGQWNSLAASLLGLVGSGQRDSLFRPLLVLANLASTVTDDEVAGALAANPNLDDLGRQLSRDLFRSMRGLAAHVGPDSRKAAEALLLTIGHTLAKFEYPRIFSFLSWKSGEVTRAHPAFS